MIHKPIYQPQGRAKEYGELAINIYDSCNHGCTYCFARKRAEQLRRPWPETVSPRRDIVESVKRQLDKGYIIRKERGGVDMFGEVETHEIREPLKNKLIHLCFSCDPYPAEIDTTPTREIIKLIKDSGNNVQILTKGGFRAERDFDLLDGGDWFGVTAIRKTRRYISPETVPEEPNAPSTVERLATLERAKERGIKTWISLEPVLSPDFVYEVIARASYIDHYKIGKLNHADTPELKAIHDSVNWAEFGRECERLCKEYGRSYYIKDDLRKEMERNNAI